MGDVSHEIVGAVSITDAENKGAMNTLFGELTVGERRDDVNVQFQYNLSDLDLLDAAGALTGTGAVNHIVNRASVESGVGVGTASITSRDSVRYRPGHECVTMFTADFTAGEANSFQHIGLFNGANGFYFGFKNTEFGVFRLDGGDETFISQANFSGDKIDGTGISGFNIVPERYNIYKISFGWLGIAPIFFSVYAGAAKGWIECHVIDLVNMQDEPHIENPSLPISVETGRSSGTGADLTIQTSSWRAGVVGEAEEDNASNRFFGDFVLDVTKTSAAIDHLFSMRSKTTFQTKANHVKTKIKILVSTNSTNKDLVFSAYRLPDVTFGAGPTWADFNTNNSVIEVAKDTTLLTEVNPPIDVAVVQIARQRANTDIEGISLYAGEAVVFGVEASGASNGTVSFQINWVEEF